MAKGYLVSVYRNISDEGKLQAYAALAKPALEAAGGRFIVRGLPKKTYEHGEAQRTVIVEFPSVDAAVAAFESPAYVEALTQLDGAALRDIRIMEGV